MSCHKVAIKGAQIAQLSGADRAPLHITRRHTLAAQGGQGPGRHRRISGPNATEKMLSRQEVANDGALKAYLGCTGRAGARVAEEDAGMAAGRLQGPAADGAAGVRQQPGVKHRVDLRAAHAPVLARCLPVTQSVSCSHLPSPAT